MVLEWVSAVMDLVEMKAMLMDDGTKGVQIYDELKGNENRTLGDALSQRSSY